MTVSSYRMPTNGGEEPDASSRSLGQIPRV